MIEQITVFLENKEGRLTALCKTLGDAGINMHALTVADTADFGLVRIIADDPQRAVDVLQTAGYRAALTKVAAIQVPNEPGGLARLLETLDSLDVNIEYGYCFSMGADFSVDVLKVHHSGEVVSAIEAAGFRVLTNEDICA
ncbi:MAG: amino acid-binding protein [Eggerthellaceae bacterium]|jgi:hypothetical protein